MQAAKLSSMKLQSLFDTTAERIDDLKRTYGDDFDKKVTLKDSLRFIPAENDKNNLFRA